MQIEKVQEEKDRVIKNNNYECSFYAFGISHLGELSQGPKKWEDGDRKRYIDDVLKHFT